MSLTAAERTKRYAARNPHKIKSKNAKQRAQKQYPEAQANRHLIRTYGITLKDKERMLRSQGGKCEICQTTIESLSDGYVDHNHVIGKIRGILCNTMLGSAKEQIFILHSAVDYLERYNVI